MDEEQEKNVSGFTRDMLNFMREGDFASALILVDDLKKYIIELKKQNK